MRTKNEGFTLVELLVSISILAVVGLGIGSFLYVSTRQYSTAGSETEIQTEVQMVQNQLTQMLLETSKGIHWNTDLLELYGYDEGKTCAVKIEISFSAGANELLYTRYRLKSGATGSSPGDWEIDGNAKNEVLGQYVSGFSVKLLDAEGNVLTEKKDPVEVSRISISIGYILGQRTWDSDFTVTPRNKISAGLDPSAFY